MRIHRLAHAGFVVAGRRATIAIDPLLSDPFEAGTSDFHPRVDIRADRVARSIDAVMFSHEHLDHFCVRSLAEFSRSATIIFPRGATLIERALDALKFHNQVPLDAGEGLSIGDLEIFGTHSLVGHPEVGYAISDGVRSVWNQVDSVIDEVVISAVIERLRGVDLLIAKYQPLVESPLWSNSLGADFPAEQYGRLLKDVSSISPTFVMAGASGYSFARSEWKNQRAFPVSEAQFAEDLALVAPAVRFLKTPPGCSIDLGRKVRVSARANRYVSSAADHDVSRTEWRPTAGVPDLRDTNSQQYEPSKLRRLVLDFVETTLPAELNSSDAAWRRRLAEAHVCWRLDVAFPNHTVRSWWMDFSSQPLRWVDRTQTMTWKIWTTTTASAVAATLRGDWPSYCFLADGVRVAHRVYLPTRQGLVVAGSERDDPLSRVLLEGADERYLEATLAKMLSKA